MQPLHTSCAQRRRSANVEMSLLRLTTARIPPFEEPQTRPYALRNCRECQVNHTNQCPSQRPQRPESSRLCLHFIRLHSSQSTVRFQECHRHVIENKCTVRIIFSAPPGLNSPCPHAHLLFVQISSGKPPRRSKVTRTENETS